MEDEQDTSESGEVVESAAESGVSEDDDEETSNESVADSDVSRSSYGSSSNNDDDDDEGLDLSWGRYSSGDDSIEDDENEVYTKCFSEAAQLLEETYGGTIECLCVIPHDNDRSEEDEADDEEQEVIRHPGNDATSFRRFVEALGRSPGRGGRGVREVHFDNVNWDVLRVVDLARFFGEVLPVHPTLETIGLAGYEIPQTYVRLLASSIGAGRSTTPLRKLQLQCAIGHESIPAVADMIRRNVPLSELRVNPLQGPKLGPDDCKSICQSMLRNTHIRVLHLHVKEALADTFDDIVARCSLTKLVVIADEWSEECVASVARQLRINTSLERMYAIKRGFEPTPFFRPIVEVLETYNITLRKVEFHWFNEQDARSTFEKHILALLRRRNRWIRRAMEQLEPRSYHLAPPSLWPLALRMVSPLPTLVFRFLRKGDLNTLCGLVQQE
jgi:hypothetical protein